MACFIGNAGFEDYLGIESNFFCIYPKRCYITIKEWSLQQDCVILFLYIECILYI